MIITPHGRVPQRQTLTSVQIGTILGLEDFLVKHGFILACPHCIEEGYPFVDTDNSPGQREWKIDCRCKQRRIRVEDIVRPLDADPDLIAQADAMLKSVSLTIRCPQPRCLKHPLDFERTPTDTIIRCRCAKTTLHPPTRPVH